ncbi:MAG TPA: transglycosylase SLT domain-containing protein, partial [Tepidiformaceae bacterium]|nr:transglycosylase SLT domain-containing protein [Tepidiformaceae bacterium]
GLASDLIDKYFTGTATQIEGVGLLEIAEEAFRRHENAFGENPVFRAALDVGEEGLVFYRHGRLADARRVLEGAVGEAGIPADALGVRWYYLGATYEDLDLGREAVAAYDQAATLANAAFRHRARYWAARVTESMDDAPGASARYRGVVAAGGGEFAAESAFRAGYVLLAARDAPGAVAAWSETGSAGGARALYWKGRALNLIGRATEARAAWEEARRIDPMSLYAHESARELGTGGLPATAYRPLPADTAIDWDAIERWLTTAAGARTGTLDVAIARELAAAGLHADAEDALLDAATTPWEQFDAMRAARDMGLPAPAVQLAFRLAGRYPDPDGVLTRIEYPLAFVRTLDAEARARNLDPLFLAALIRQESLWDEKAGSTAGALGLTQVIPPTGQAIAGELGVSAFRAEDLFRPSVALRFGAYYIAAQIAKYGTPWAALSAYNAGPGAADRWTRAAGRAAAADYIEVVDYSETHAYVAYVLDHYARYMAEYR